MAELASSMSHNEAEEEKLRMQEFEDAFRHIRYSATMDHSLSPPEEV